MTLLAQLREAHRIQEVYRESYGKRHRSTTTAARGAELTVLLVSAWPLVEALIEAAQRVTASASTGDDFSDTWEDLCAALAAFTEETR